MVTSHAPGAMDRLRRGLEMETGGTDEESTRVVARELWPLVVLLALVALTMESALADRGGTGDTDRRGRKGWTSID